MDAAAIDDQPIVRAQDLGERNIELIRYYAGKQPQRRFYRFDQKTRALTELGSGFGVQGSRSQYAFP